MGTFTIEVQEHINQPPQTVGDYSTTIPNRDVLVFTSSMFTTNTTPPYQDPENDPADAIRIDSLPQDGVIKYNNIPVIVGQIISIDDINNGLLIYESPDQDSADIDNFNFSVRDTGSLQFVS